jgi:hypothetical protein
VLVASSREFHRARHDTQKQRFMISKSVKTDQDEQSDDARSSSNICKPFKVIQEAVRKLYREDDLDGNQKTIAVLLLCAISFTSWGWLF